ncbi:MAG: hypothetical protein KBA02_00230 [Paludibacteraceae bacterium]|nr:hypothetical protein [Paludibacteraceae bacterium]
MNKSKPVSEFFDKQWEKPSFRKAYIEETYKEAYKKGLDKAMEAIRKVIEDTEIPQDFDMNDLLDIERDITEELKKLKEEIK